MSRFPLAARLALTLVAVALLTLVLQGLFQDRAASRGMGAAAAARLDASAHAVERLLGEHLHDLVERHVAVSRTPELRANLEVGHGPTLRQMAETLAKQSGASQLVFLDADWKLRAQVGVGDPRRSLVAAWNELRAVRAPRITACIGSEPDAPHFDACRFGRDAGPQATLQRVGVAARALVMVPLETGQRRVGWMLVAQPLDAALLDGWSELVGARVGVEGAEAETDADRVRTVYAAGDLDLRVFSSLGPELATLAAMRRSQSVAALVALWVTVLASIWVARGFLRPIREIRDATERVGRGDLDVRLRSSRSDEIGDVARVLDDTLDRLRRSQQRLLNVQRIAHFGDWSIDLARDAVEGSAEFERVLGLPEQWTGTLGAFLRCFDAGDRVRLDDMLTRCAQGGAPIDMDLRCGNRTHFDRVVHVRANRVAGDSQRIEGSVQDVTDRRRAEEQIRFLAFHDSLTSLPNRRFLSERLALAMTPDQSRGFALMFVDLDRFKLVNDTLGHSAGDQLLCHVASRLSRAVRDEDRSAVARFGGDEFTVLLPDVTDERRVVEVAQELLRSVSSPVEIEGQEMTITASVGIARWPADGETIEALLRSCDTALHRAKGAGRNVHVLYDPSMEEEAKQRWKLENRLRRAVEAMDFEVYYQPRVRASDGVLTGFEALLRWHDDEFGGYKPDVFIPIAEETGLIVPLGSWVLRSVLHQVRGWLDEGLDVPCISVNLSGRQLTRNLAELVRDAIRSADVDPARLEIEITESAVIEDSELGVAVLGELRELGVRLVLDDFGTGYSSLSYLRSLPISGVKIDRSFVRSLGDERDTALVGSIVSMAKVLGLAVIAEGVETDEQAELLAEMECDELQGFLYGEATPADEARRRIATPPPKRKRAQKPLR